VGEFPIGLGAKEFRFDTRSKDGLAAGVRPEIALFPGFDYIFGGITDFLLFFNFLPFLGLEIVTTFFRYFISLTFLDRSIFASSLSFLKS
jgi:hypothetical protein